MESPHLSPDLAGLFAVAAQVGFAKADRLLGGAELAAIEDDLRDLVPKPLDPEVGQVRQAGAVAVAAIDGRPSVQALADLLGGASGGWKPDELALMVYGPGEGITPHRDNTFYEGFVAIVGLTGAGRFAVVKDRAGSDVIEEWEVGAGDLVLIRGPDPGGRRDRPMHTVTAGAEGRRSLTLRRNLRGAGRGWS